MEAMLLTIGFPFFGAVAGLLLPKKYRPAFSVLVLGLTFLMSVIILKGVVRDRGMLITGGLTNWFNLSFIIDGLSVFMAGVASLLAVLIGVYSLEYLREHEEKGTFYFWMLLFVGSMMGLVFSANLLLTFCFWEITSLCSWRLIGFYRKEKDIQAANKAFLLTFFGASTMLIAIIFIYLNYGTLDFALLRGQPLPDLLAFLILVGILSKSAQLPLQSWLPDAMVAPTPVIALFDAAVLVKIGIFVFARLFGMVFVASPEFFNTVVLLSVITIIVAAGSAIIESNMKRILAYSTMSQLGYIMLALGINTATAFRIALLYILAHSLSKAGLFLCVGILEHKSGAKDIGELGGWLKTMPLTATAYLLCAFSIIGIPPFLGFWPKLLLILEAAREGYIFAAILAVVGAVFTMFYLFRLFDKVFLGEEKIAVSEEKRSPMVGVVLILGALSLLLGLGFKLPFNLISLLIK
ncbi:MAG: NADH-quinone oxidoreductase subunit L [Candidatus Omnitrophota bacterium]